MTKESDSILDRILAELEKDLGKKVQRFRGSKENKEILKRLGLTDDEANSWNQDEPDFRVPPKRPPRGKLTEHPLGGVPPWPRTTTRLPPNRAPRR